MQKSFVGIETSAAAITFCMFELSVNEEIQKKARESVHKALNNHGGLTYEALNEMQYLQQCISGRFSTAFKIKLQSNYISMLFIIFQKRFVYTLQYQVCQELLTQITQLQIQTS